MNKTTIEVKVIPPHMGLHDRLQAFDVPSHSRLYGLVPCGIETVWSESLTSYINRLGWSHGVAPRTLAIQEIRPLLESHTSVRQMGKLCTANAMRINGLGKGATTWSTVLEQLTLIPFLHLLTSSWWLGDFPNQRHLRASPAWCPACYTEWKEQGLPIYQPLLWMLLILRICPKHNRALLDRCPHCQAKQAVIASHPLHAGKCTKCARWLGIEPASLREITLDNGTVNWQQWVVRVLGDLRTVNVSSGLIRWEPFFANLANVTQQRGNSSQLAHLSGINHKVLIRWNTGKATPSIEMLLKFCYTFEITPLQLLSGQMLSLEQAIQDKVALHPPQHQPTPQRLLDPERARELIQAILDGREPPLRLYQLAKRLGCDDGSLRRGFPQECTLLIQLAQASRKQQNEQQMAQMCERVREEVKALHAQGIFPTSRRVKQVLPPGAMRRPQVTATWHEVLRELGLKP